MSRQKLLVYWPLPRGKRVLRTLSSMIMRGFALAFEVPLYDVSIKHDLVAERTEPNRSGAGSHPSLRSQVPMVSAPCVMSNAGMVVTTPTALPFPSYGGGADVANASLLPSHALVLNPYSGQAIGIVSSAPAGVRNAGYIMTCRTPTPTPLAPTGSSCAYFALPHPAAFSAVAAPGLQYYSPAAAPPSVFPSAAPLFVRTPQGNFVGYQVGQLPSGMALGLAQVPAEATQATSSSVQATAAQPTVTAATFIGTTSNHRLPPVLPKSDAPSATRHGHSTTNHGHERAHCTSQTVKATVRRQATTSSITGTSNAVAVITTVGAARSATAVTCESFPDRGRQEPSPPTPPEATIANDGHFALACPRVGQRFMCDGAENDDKARLSQQPLHVEPARTPPQSCSGHTAHEEEPTCKSESTGSVELPSLSFADSALPPCSWSAHDLFMSEANTHSAPRPHILTHFIDGFIIQESGEPFSISPCPFDEFVSETGLDWSEPPPRLEVEDQTFGHTYKREGSAHVWPCGSKMPRLDHRDDDASSEMSSWTAADSPSLTAPSPPFVTPDKNLEEWTVDEVFAFICSLGSGLLDSAQKFRKEEIDGPALKLLSPEQMVREPMGLKLGPALKIGSAVERLLALPR